MTPSYPTEKDWKEAEELARKFHDTYERLAPLYGYETRKETREFDPKTANGKLMIAVCGEVVASIEQERKKETPSNRQWKDVGYREGREEEKKEWYLALTHLSEESRNSVLATKAGISVHLSTLTKEK